MDKVLFKGKIDKSKLSDRRAELFSDIDWVEGHYFFYDDEHKILVVSENKDMDGCKIVIYPHTLSQYIGINDDGNGVKIFNHDVVVVDYEEDEHPIKPDYKPLVGFVTYEYGCYIVVESWNCATEFNENHTYFNFGSIYDKGNEEYLERYKEWIELKSL